MVYWTDSGYWIDSFVNVWISKENRTKRVKCRVLYAEAPSLFCRNIRCPNTPKNSGVCIKPFCKLCSEKCFPSFPSFPTPIFVDSNRAMSGEASGNERVGRPDQVGLCAGSRRSTRTLPLVWRCVVALRFYPSILQEVNSGQRYTHTESARPVQTSQSSARLESANGLLLFMSCRFIICEFVNAGGILIKRAKFEGITTLPTIFRHHIRSQSRTVAPTVASFIFAL